MYFTEQLMDAFEKPSRESDLNYKISNFLIRQLKNTPASSFKRFTHKSKYLQHNLTGKSKCNGARLRSFQE
jgi:hypothetical protein